MRMLNDRCTVCGNWPVVPVSSSARGANDNPTKGRERQCTVMISVCTSSDQESGKSIESSHVGFVFRGVLIIAFCRVSRM